MSYPGSKGQAGTFQRIIGQMPPHHLYVEAFFGSGRIFKTKRLAAENMIIDKRADCVFPFGDQPGVSATQGDAISLLDLMGENLMFNTRNTVIYCDPPYLLSTRQGRFYYEHEMTDDDHARLLDVLKRLDCHVLLSGYPSDLYERELKEWRCIKYQTRFRGGTKTRLECLWCNFPEPTELHDWRFAGKNFRERTSLKRLAARYLARLEAMPARKRGYVLNAIRVATAPSADSGVGGSKIC